MKKLLTIFAFILLAATASQAQYKPNMQLILKGIINVPFYDSISDNTGNGSFAGVQIEPVVNYLPDGQCSEHLI